jgi:hypothetical protein
LQLRNAGTKLFVFVLDIHKLLPNGLKLPLTIERLMQLPAQGTRLVLRARKLILSLLQPLHGRVVIGVSCSEVRSYLVQSGQFMIEARARRMEGLTLGDELLLHTLMLTPQLLALGRLRSDFCLQSLRLILKAAAFDADRFQLTVSGFGAFAPSPENGQFSDLRVECDDLIAKPITFDSALR